MFGDEGAAVVAGWKLFAAVKGELQRCDVSAEQHVGNNGAGHEFGMFLLYAGIHVAADVAVWPAVEAAILDTGEIIGRKIVAEFIAFIDGDPGNAGNRLEGQSDGIAQAGGKLASIVAIEIANGNCGAHRRFTGIDVTAGADRNEQMLAIGSQGEGSS